MSSFTYFIFNFFLYGFIGWIIENVYSYVVTGSFQKDGFLNGPFKPMYGIAMSILIGVETHINKVILIILCFIVPTLVEYLTGALMKTYFNKKYWDYSKEKYNYKGIICLKFSIYWTILTYIGVEYFQVYVIENIYNYLGNLNNYILFMLIVIFCIDFIATLRYFKQRKRVA